MGLFVLRPFDHPAQIVALGNYLRAMIDGPTPDLYASIASCSIANTQLSHLNTGAGVYGLFTMSNYYLAVFSSGKDISLAWSADGLTYIDCEIPSTGVSIANHIDLIDTPQGPIMVESPMYSNMASLKRSSDGYNWGFSESIGAVSNSNAMILVRRFAGDLYVFSNGFQEIFKSTDEGNTWSQIATATLNFQGYFTAPVYVSGRIAYFEADGSGTLSMHSSIDGMQTWSQEAIFSIDPGRFVTHVSEFQGTVVILTDGNGGKKAISSSNLVDWTQTQVTGTPSDPNLGQECRFQYLIGMNYAPSIHGDGNIYGSNDKINWTVLPLTLNTVGFQLIDQNKMVSAQQGTVGYSGQTIYFQPLGSLSWAPEYYTSEPIFTLKFLAGDFCVFPDYGGNSDFSKVYQSANGINWDVSSTVTAPPIPSDPNNDGMTQPLDFNHNIFALNGTIYYFNSFFDTNLQNWVLHTFYSNDHMSTWTALPTYDNETYVEVVLTDGVYIYAFVFGADWATTKLMLRSSDGLVWTVLPTWDYNWLYLMDISTYTYQLFDVFNNVAAVSNNGINWTRVFS